VDGRPGIGQLARSPGCQQIQVIAPALCLSNALPKHHPSSWVWLAFLAEPHTDGAPSRPAFVSVPPRPPTPNPLAPFPTPSLAPACRLSSPKEIPRAFTQASQATGRSSMEPAFVVDHREVRRNYATFRKYLPRVQAYYAVRPTPTPASCAPVQGGRQLRRGLHARVHDRAREHPVYACQEATGLDWDKIIYANPSRTTAPWPSWIPTASRHLRQPGRGGQGQAPRPARGSHPAHQRANTGSVVELSSKFGASPARPWI